MLYRGGRIGLSDGGQVIIPPTGGVPISRPGAPSVPVEQLERPTLRKGYTFRRVAPVYPPSDDPLLPPSAFVSRKDVIYGKVDNDIPSTPSPVYPASPPSFVALSPEAPPGSAHGGGAPPPGGKAGFCPPPNQWVYTAFNASGQPCGWACHPRDTGGVVTPCKAGSAGGAAQGSSGGCVSDFVRPGIAALGCECYEIPGASVNKELGILSREIAEMTAVLQMDPAIVQERMNTARYYAGQDLTAALLVKHAQYGFASFAYAQNYGCCWPLSADNWVRDGGIYVRAGGLCAAIVTSLYSLVELTYELRTDPSYTGPKPPQWPVAFPIDNSLAGIAGPSPQDLHSGLLVCNNLISNMLAVARMYASQLARANETIRQCTAGRAPTTSLTGYSPRLGSGSAPRTQPTTEIEFVLYYLSRYPAIAYMLPSQAASASDLASEMDRAISELVNGVRAMKSDLISSEQIILACGRGNGPGPGYVPPSVPMFPEPAPLDPSIDIPFLPNPYTQGEFPGVPTLSPGPTVQPDGNVLHIVEDTESKGEFPEAGMLAFLAVVGAGLLARR